MPNKFQRTTFSVMPCRHNSITSRVRFMRESDSSPEYDSLEAPGRLQLGAVLIAFMRGESALGVHDVITKP